MESNYSLYALPVHFFITLVPHAYAVRLAKSHNNNRWDNSNPRCSTWDSTLQKSLPAAIYARYTRAESAHKNGLENFPLIAAAIFAGNLAKLDITLLNTAALGYVLSRVLYTVLYINIDRVRYSYIRTATYGAGLFTCFYLLVKSANAMR